MLVTGCAVDREPISRLGKLCATFYTPSHLPLPNSSWGISQAHRQCVSYRLPVTDESLERFEHEKKGKYFCYPFQLRKKKLEFNILLFFDFRLTLHKSSKKKNTKTPGNNLQTGMIEHYEQFLCSGKVSADRRLPAGVFFSPSDKDWFDLLVCSWVTIRMWRCRPGGAPFRW